MSGAGEQATSAHGALMSGTRPLLSCRMRKRMGLFGSCSRQVSVKADLHSESSELDEGTAALQGGGVVVAVKRRRRRR